MSTVITIATSKGGAGKTTTAELLLGAYASQGRRVAAIDADLNHSLSDWINRFDQYPMTLRQELDEAKIIPLVEALADDHDVIVIDTAGAATQATVFAIGCADLVLIPCQLSSADVVEAAKTTQLVASAAAMSRQSIPARVLLTDYQPNTVIAGHVESELVACGLDVIPTKLNRLVAFKEMTFTGTIPTDGGAGALITSLLRDVATIVPALNTPCP
ncbi:ParA family protein [uncultured Tateyamaria sp.]|uniref:ParA family protein n=1 Tax=uncultured Tateyamaria sp. TaxID=455651 RepID=UPI00262DF49A|nr:ParA family protein [uncultured Tateyamaria sp.]